MPGKEGPPTEIKKVLKQVGDLKVVAYYRQAKVDSATIFFEFPGGWTVLPGTSYSAVIRVMEALERDEKRRAALVRENKGRDLHIQKLVDALHLLKNKLNPDEKCSYCGEEDPHDCDCIWRRASEAIYYDPEDDFEILDALTPKAPK